MYTKINSQASLDDVITLSEAKRQCRLMDSFTLDDDELNMLRIACTELAQTYLHRLLSIGSVTLEKEEYVKWVQLPYGDATTIAEVLVDDVVTTDYTFSDVTQKVKLGDNVISTNFSNIKITYSCGMSEVPMRIKQGILVMISTMYNQHDDYVVGMSVEQIPMNARAILHSGKYYAT